LATKLIAAGMGGVFVPILIEFGAKGARISDQFPFKWSGVVGVIAGAVPIGLHFAKPGFYQRMSDSNKTALVAFGASSLATGMSILVLDELRKRAVYQFRGEVPLGHSEGTLPLPPSDMIKEI